MEESSNACSVEIPLEVIIESLTVRLGTTKFVYVRHEFESLKRVGMLGDHSVLRVYFTDSDIVEKTVSYFVKCVPKLEVIADFAVNTGAFRKEIFAYRLLKKFGDSGIGFASNIAPVLYQGKPDQYLILENASENKFEMIDKHKTLDYDSVLIILKCLAKLHASSIIYEEKTGKSLLDIYREDLEESFFNDSEGFVNLQGVTASIVGVIKEIDILAFPKKLNTGKNFADVAEKFCYTIYDLVKPLKKFRNVFSHGDLWATNYLVKYNTSGRITDCRLIDFQCARYSPPGQDVLSFLYLNTSRSFRREHLFELLGIYYKYLEDLLKLAGLNPNIVLPFSEFIEGCQHQKPFAIIQTAIYLPLVLVDNVEELFSDQDESEKMFTEDRSLMFVKYMDKSESYKSRVRESIQDLKDCCEYL